MDQMVVKAVKRTETGKRAARQIRKTGNLPAVMYNSKGESVMLSVNEAAFTKVWKSSTPTTLVNLLIDDKDAGTAFIKATEYDIKTDKNLHVDFHVIEKDKPLKAILKVHFSGNPVGVREGGKFFNHTLQIAVKCLPKDLPAKLEADVSGLGIGSTFRVKDLQIGSGVTVLTNAETSLASISVAS